MAPEGEPASPSVSASDVSRLDAGVRSLAASVQRLREQTHGWPGEFFTRWSGWRRGWDAFAGRLSRRSGNERLSTEDRARFQQYARQYDSIRRGVLRALTPPWQRTASNAGGWPWWVWALLAGGAAVAWKIKEERGEE